MPRHTLGFIGRLFGRRQSPRAGYDFSENRNAAGGALRRHHAPETRGEESVLTPAVRHLGIAAVRDALRNDAATRGLSRTLRVNVVGDLGKLSFRARDEWMTAAADYFKEWGREADFRDGTTWRECLQLVVSTLAMEGDFVAIFDDGILSGGNGTGKIAFVDGDKICDLADFDEWKKETSTAQQNRSGWTQTSGVIHNELGRKVGVVVSKKRGQSSTTRDEAFVLLCDPDDRESAPWRHVLRKFRFAQCRGSADSFCSVGLAQDGREMLTAELQSAKFGATRYATAIADTLQAQDRRSLPNPDAFDRSLGLPPGGSDQAAASSDAAPAEPPQNIGDTDGDDEDAAPLPRLPAFSKILAGKAAAGFDVVEGVKQIVFDPTQRPNTKLVEFLDSVGDLIGRAHGLSHSYVRCRADGSYTAFRGDMAMTWATFRDNQQFLEDNFSDWLARKVLGWAVARGKLGKPPARWDKQIAWVYPRMPAVDAEKEERAFCLAYKNGTTTLARELGPAWLDMMEEQKAEREAAEERDLSYLAIFESTPGAENAAAGSAPATETEKGK